MATRSYLVTVQTDIPDFDFDQVAFAIGELMAESINYDSNHDFRFEVSRADGTYVDGYEYLAEDAT